MQSLNDDTSTVRSPHSSLLIVLIHRYFLFFNMHISYDLYETIVVIFNQSFSSETNNLWPLILAASWNYWYWNLWPISSKGVSGFGYCLPLLTKFLMMMIVLQSNISCQMFSLFSRVSCFFLLCCLPLGGHHVFIFLMFTDEWTNGYKVHQSDEGTRVAQTSISSLFFN